MDLNLDIWGLSEISPRAIGALVDELKESFGETYHYALSEPDSSDGKQSTAVIWKPSQVNATKVPWPSDVEPMFHLDSRDPQVDGLEALHGKIFDRYPGLFHFELTGRSPFDFYLVPLHMKAMAKGSLRRRLASRILVKAVESLIADTGESDVLLGGDVNAPLASGDFDALTSADFTPMGAADEQAGGFSYLKGPRSLIDNIFLSPNITRTVGALDYFIVAKERSIDDYIRRISDHRPVLLRISLNTPSSQTARAAADQDIDALIERLRRSTDENSAAARAPRKQRRKVRNSG